MQSLLRSQVSGWVGLAAAGALASVLMLSGCPGTLDPRQFPQTGSGGSNGTGGGNPSGGSTGTGGTTDPNCTGGNNGASVVMSQCAVSGCHSAADANTAGAGLDLTVDATIGSRLVGVVSPGDTNSGSLCGGNTEPYLDPNSTPATGLLIDKIRSSPKCTANSACCGQPMPYPGIQLLTPQQQTCLIEWATTLTMP